MGLFGKAHKKVAAEFVLETASDYHVAFGTTPAFYNEDRGQIELLPAAKDLEDALIAYNESVDLQFRFDIQNCTLHEVVTELDHAREAYEKKAQGVPGILRRGVRAMGNYADQITPWIELIPSDHGLSFLSAGLKIIFGIARQNATNRDKILEAFENIPDLMLSVKERQNQWATARALRTRATQLYDTLARAVARLIFLLNGSLSHAPRWGERALRRLRSLAPSAQTAHIDSILNEVKNQAALFDQCLERVRDQRAIDTGADVAAAKIIAERTDSQVKALALAAETRHAEVMEWMKSHESGPTIMNRLHQTIVYIQPREDPVRNSQAPGLSPRFEPLLDEIELHDILGVSPQQPANDLLLVVKELAQFDVAAQAQAQQLFASRTFASWMASTEPAIMLVHGNFDITGPGRITALSVLCAMFALELRHSTTANDEQIIVLHYFCGLHASRHNPLDSLAGPNGLMRSILAQLLQINRRYNLDFINTRSFVHDLETHNLQMLCHTFHQLIEQLPRKVTVVCILDGLSEFASQRFSADLADVLHILNRLVTHPGLRPNFKLLGTTPFARAGLLDQQLTVQYPLELQRFAVEDGYGTGLTERSVHDLVSQSDRLDHFRMQMGMNRAAEQEKIDIDSENESDWSE